MSRARRIVGELRARPWRAGVAGIVGELRTRPWHVGTAAVVAGLLAGPRAPLGVLVAAGVAPLFASRA